MSGCDVQWVFTVRNGGKEAKCIWAGALPVWEGGKKLKALGDEFRRGVPKEITHANLFAKNFLVLYGARKKPTMKKVGASNSVKKRKKVQLRQGVGLSSPTLFIQRVAFSKKSRTEKMGLQRIKKENRVRGRDLKERPVDPRARGKCPSSRRVKAKGIAREASTSRTTDGGGRRRRGRKVKNRE